MSETITIREFTDILDRAEAAFLEFFETLAQGKRWASFELAMPALWLLRRARQEIDPPHGRDPENRTEKENPPATGSGRMSAEEADRQHLRAIVAEAEVSLIHRLQITAEQEDWSTLDAAFPALAPLAQARRHLEGGLRLELPKPVPATASQDDRTEKENEPTTTSGSGSELWEPREIPPPEALRLLRTAETELLALLVKAVNGADRTWSDLLLPSLAHAHRAVAGFPGLK